MKTPSLEFSFTPVDNHRLASLCGSMDANIRQIEAALDVAIARRGEKFSVTGERAKIELAAKILNRFYAKAHNDFSVEEIQLGIVQISHARDTKAAKATDTTANEEIALQTRRADLRAVADDANIVKIAHPFPARAFDDEVVQQPVDGVGHGVTFAFAITPRDGFHHGARLVD